MLHEAIDNRTPIDTIEPELNVRDAGLRYVELLEGFADRIQCGINEGNLRSAQVAFYSAAYALGLKCCGGMSMTQRAEQLGVRRATISKGAKKFVESNGLSPSFYMKDKQAGHAYCHARLRVVANGCNRA